MVYLSYVNTRQRAREREQQQMDGKFCIDIIVVALVFAVVISIDGVGTKTC